jgi:hypothetical protein
MHMFRTTHLTHKLLFVLAGAALILFCTPYVARAAGAVVTLPDAAGAQGSVGGVNCTPGANGFIPLACVDQSGKLADIYQSPDLSTFINDIFKFAIGIGAIAAVLRLAYAGYLYMGQADMWSSKGKAKEIIGDTTLGLLLLLSIYLILYQINPDIVKLRVFDQIQNSPVQNSQIPTGNYNEPGPAF